MDVDVQKRNEVRTVGIYIVQKEEKEKGNKHLGVYV